MNFQVFQGVMLPFIGTTLGAFFVFLMKNHLSNIVQRSLSGFAAGVMVAASIWSLIIPAIDLSSSLDKFSFLPSVIGFWLGVILLLVMDNLVPHIHIGNDENEGLKSNLSKTLLMMFAVVIHNIPEGMAVGIVFASLKSANTPITLAASFSLSIGIAIQNIPEGAIISLPLHSKGISKFKSFIYGTLSGIVEPIFAIITVMLSSYILPFLPYFLGFAAGAMMYVVVEELIPEMSKGHHSNIPSICFSLGFTIMMVLDVVLG